MPREATAPEALELGILGSCHGLAPGLVDRDQPMTIATLARMVLPDAYGVVSRALPPLAPMLLEAGTVPLDVFHSPAAQFQGGGLEGAKDLLLHQVVDRR